MNEENILEIEGLGKSYGEFEALQDLTINVPKGEIYAFLGPNGAGKTTTIKMLMGILQPSAGTARIGGLDCFKDRVEVKRMVGYLPDDPIFYDYLKGSETIQFVGEMFGLTREEITERSEPLVAKLDLADALSDYAVNYSRGMKKKLGMICSLLHNPSLLILDEPTNGLDPYASRVLHELIREQAAKGKSVFFSTHLLDQAEKLCDRIAILFKGKLVAAGSLEELRLRLAKDANLEEIFFSVTSADKDEANFETREAGNAQNQSSETSEGSTTPNQNIETPEDDTIPTNTDSN